MTDSLGFRKKFAVLIPSTNTSVQPEFDAMRPVGVTNHISRIRHQSRDGPPGWRRRDVDGAAGAGDQHGNLLACLARIGHHRPDRRIRPAA